MNDERWTLGIAENGDIRLQDLKTGETFRFGGPRGLFDALGKLADWRERMPDNRHYGATVEGTNYCATCRREEGRPHASWCTVIPHHGAPSEPIDCGFRMGDPCSCGYHEELPAGTLANPGRTVRTTHHKSDSGA